MTNVSSIMSKNPVKAIERATLSQIIALMVKHSVGSIIIVDSKNIPCGIVTERELLRDIATNARVSIDTKARDLMSLNFIRIPPTMGVKDAARAMTKGGMRIVVVKKKGQLFGVVSTSDVLRFFNKTVKDVSIDRATHQKVQTMDGSRGVLDAIKIMHEKRIGSVVITNSGLPFGIVTERDLLRILAKRRRKDFGSLRVGDLATKPLISAPYGIKAREASSIMVSNKIKRLPIFRGDRLVGIVTARDLVGAYSTSIEARSGRKEIRLIV